MVQTFLPELCLEHSVPVMEVIKDAEEKYSTQSPDSVPDWLTQEIVHILHLEDKVIFLKRLRFFR